LIKYFEKLKIFVSPDPQPNGNSYFQSAGQRESQFIFIPKSICGMWNVNINFLEAGRCPRTAAVPISLPVQTASPRL
jgi:hypothetical protein